jgi:hypothetical protein
VSTLAGRSCGELGGIEHDALSGSGFASLHTICEEIESTCRVPRLFDAEHWAPSETPSLVWRACRWREDAFDFSLRLLLSGDTIETNPLIFQKTLLSSAQPRHPPRPSS